MDEAREGTVLFLMNYLPGASKLRALHYKCPESCTGVWPLPPTPPFPLYTKQSPSSFSEQTLGSMASDRVGLMSPQSFCRVSFQETQVRSAGVASRDNWGLRSMRQLTQGACVCSLSLCPVSLSSVTHLCVCLSPRPGLYAYWPPVLPILVPLSLCPFLSQSLSSSVPSLSSVVCKLLSATPPSLPSTV